MLEFQPQIFGKYLLLEKIGVGGTAEIYKAKTYGAKGFEKIVAIKKVLPEFSNQADFINMLVNEAKVIVRLFHPNIIEVYDLGCEADCYYFAMELVEGVDLKKLLQRVQVRGLKLSYDVVAFLLSEVCTGLHFAHHKKDANGQALNIIHRDISPHNILVGFNGEIKITDFGIAKAALSANLTQTGVLKGKLSYMSPEQASGGVVDQRADIFATGLVLYELLAGKKFFDGESIGEVLSAIINTTMQADDLPQDVPLELKKIVVRAMAKDAKQRYQNAGDMADDLLKFLHSNYTGFSRRRFTSLVEDLFREDIKILQEKTVKITEITWTGSQPASGDRAISVASNISVVTDVKGKKSQSSRRWWIGVVLFMILGGGMGLWQWQPWEQAPMLQGGVPSALVARLDRFIQPKIKLYLYSKPAGAWVFLNGVQTVYLTPASVELNPKMNYRVRLEKEGYEPWEGELAVEKPDQIKEVILKKILR